MAVKFEKTQANGRPFAAVTLLQERGEHSEVIRVRCWGYSGPGNGLPEVGKSVTVEAQVRAFVDGRKNPMLSADVFQDSKR
jgi:hypothetical protein